MSQDDNSYHGYKPRPFQSRADTIAHMREKRYSGEIFERDPAYQKWVEACIAMTEGEHTGANGRELNEALGQPAQRDFQDPLNTLGTMQDVYRDMSEARRDQTSQLYKESGFERQRVAEKIGRSVPDGVVHSSKQYASLQVMGGDGEEESGE